MNRIIPVTIFSGFLGSGKTTLIANLVSQLEDKRLLIIVNEFGAVSIDDQTLTETANSCYVEVAKFSGSLIGYGTQKDEFVRLMKSVKERTDIDHIIIETSGLAAPSAVSETIQSKELSSNFIIDACIVVVDAPLLKEGKFADGGDDAGSHASAELFNSQLEYADVVALNKVDKLEKPELVVMADQIRATTPTVRFIELAYQGNLDPRVSLGLKLNQPVFEGLSELQESEIEIGLEDSGVDGHSHSGLGPHVHGVRTHEHLHEHDPGWLSFSLSCSELQDPATLTEAIISLTQASSILRIKGFINCDDGHLYSLQSVRDNLHLERVDQTKNSFGNKLVVIGYHTKREEVSSVLSRMTSRQWS